jgi:hypothetical protein
MHVTQVVHLLKSVQDNHRHQSPLQNVKEPGRASPFEWEEVAEVQTVVNLDKDRESDGSIAPDLRYWQLMCNWCLSKLSLRQHC